MDIEARLGSLQNISPPSKTVSVAWLINPESRGISWMEEFSDYLLICKRFYEMFR